MQIAVVWTLLKLKPTTVLIEQEKLIRHVLCYQIFWLRLHLLLSNLVVPLVAVFYWRQTVPWQFTIDKVNHDVG